MKNMMLFFIVVVCLTTAQAQLLPKKSKTVYIFLEKEKRMGVYPLKSDKKDTVGIHYIINPDTITYFEGGYSMPLRSYSVILRLHHQNKYPHTTDDFYSKQKLQRVRYKKLSFLDKKNVLRKKEIFDNYLLFMSKIYAARRVYIIDKAEIRNDTIILREVIVEKVWRL